jgi:hypothetical protein
LLLWLQLQVLQGHYGLQLCRHAWHLPFPLVDWLNQQSPQQQQQQQRVMPHLASLLPLLLLLLRRRRRHGLWFQSKHLLLLLLVLAGPCAPPLAPHTPLHPRCCPCYPFQAL